MILEPLRISKRWKVFCFGCFMIKKPKRKFILNLIVEVIGFFTLKKAMNKDAKSICGEEGIMHEKSKEIEVEKFKVAKLKEAEEVCSYS
jgi:hypothetical protein